MDMYTQLGKDILSINTTEDVTKAFRFLYNNASPATNKNEKQMPKYHLKNKDLLWTQQNIWYS